MLTYLYFPLLALWNAGVMWITLFKAGRTEALSKRLRILFGHSMDREGQEKLDKVKLALILVRPIKTYCMYTAYVLARM